VEKSEWIWMNGEYVPWDNANVHVLSHGLHYGTGVFEGIRAYETDRGTAIFRHREHLERLVRSAQLYDIYKPASPSGDIGAGERSMTVRLELLDDENTLTDERIDAVVAQVLANLSARLGVRLRG